MAGVRIGCDTGAVTGAATKTLAQLVAATNQRVRVERVRVSGKGTSPTDAPVLVELLVQTSAGTSAALTVNKLNPNDDETLQTTALQTFSAEPSGNTPVLASQHVHPQAAYDFVFPPGRDLYVKGGTRLGVRLNSPAQSSTFAVQIEAEE